MPPDPPTPTQINATPTSKTVENPVSTGKDDYSWVDIFPVRWKDHRKFAARMYSL